MKKVRPVNLDLTTIRLPITAIVSILHRLSGVLMFLFIPALLWMLQASAFSDDGFVNMQNSLTSPVGKVVIWVILSATFYHLVAGIRHILMDFGLGETKQSGPMGARITLIIGIILAILTGVWLW